MPELIEVLRLPISEEFLHISVVFLAYNSLIVAARPNLRGEEWLVLLGSRLPLELHPTGRLDSQAGRSKLHGEATAETPVRRCEQDGWLLAGLHRRGVTLGEEVAEIRQGLDMGRQKRNVRKGLPNLHTKERLNLEFRLAIWIDSRDTPWRQPLVGSGELGMRSGKGGAYPARKRLGALWAHKRPPVSLERSATGHERVAHGVHHRRLQVLAK